MKTERAWVPHRPLVVFLTVVALLGVAVGAPSLQAEAVHPAAPGLEGLDILMALSATPEEGQSPLRLAADVAIAFSRVQVQGLGAPSDAGWHVPAPDAPPSEAARELFRAVGLPMPEASDADLAQLDHVPAELARSLTRTFHAFLAFDRSARSTDLESSAPERLSPFSRARLGLLEAAVALGEASAPASPSERLPVFQLPPVLAVDLAGVDNAYQDDFALVIDIGGNDVYTNNAGGSGLRVFGPHECQGSLLPLAAAVIDLGGSDRYVSGRSCGVNGGAYRGGAGFLLDASGDDIYAAGSSGVNGGGDQGHGFLIDAEGTDTYVGAAHGVNGGAWRPTLAALASSGFLLDASGDDVYDSFCGGTNGGNQGGRGSLIDLEGSDQYLAACTPGTPFGGGTNGGVSPMYIAGSQLFFLEDPFGPGLLLDASGTDTYREGTLACQDCTVLLKDIFGNQVDMPPQQLGFVDNLLANLCRDWGICLPPPS